LLAEARRVGREREDSRHLAGVDDAGVLQLRDQRQHADQLGLELRPHSRIYRRARASPLRDVGDAVERAEVRARLRQSLAKPRRLAAGDVHAGANAWDDLAAAARARPKLPPDLILRVAGALHSRDSLAHAVGVHPALGRLDAHAAELLLDLLVGVAGSP
jgi:hypothetical protein